MLKHISPLVIACFAVGCGAAPDTTSSAVESTSSALLDNPAEVSTYALTRDVSTLRFNADWRNTRAGRIMPFGNVRVLYDARRLGSCAVSRLEPSSTLPEISLQLVIDKSPVITLPLKDMLPILNADGNTDRPLNVEWSFPVPNGRQLAMWFHVKNTATSCESWDSNMNRNYNFSITKLPTIMFNPDGTTAVDGQLLPGRQVVIDYDKARVRNLPSSCDSVGREPRPQAFFANYRINDGSAVRDMMLLDSPQSSPSMAILRDMVTQGMHLGTRITLPSDAKTLEMWFNTMRLGTPDCNVYDSAAGQNYKFDIVQRTTPPSDLPQPDVEPRSMTGQSEDLAQVDAEQTSPSTQSPMQQGAQTQQLPMQQQGAQTQQTEQLSAQTQQTPMQQQSAQTQQTPMQQQGAQTQQTEQQSAQAQQTPVQQQNAQTEQSAQTQQTQQTQDSAQGSGDTTD